MTFDDWWGAYPTQEDYEANCRDAWDASAASRDAEVAEIRRGNSAAVSAYTTCSDERDQLREQVKMLRDAILLFRNEPILGRAHGIRGTDGYGAMQSALAATEHHENTTIYSS